MGTVHQLRWDRPRARSSSVVPRRRALRPADLLLFFVVVAIVGAVGAKALWHEASPPHFMASVWVIDGDSLRTASEEIRLVGIDAPAAIPAATGKAANGRAAAKPRPGLQRSLRKATWPACRVAATVTAARSLSALRAISRTLAR